MFENLRVETNEIEVSILTGTRRIWGMRIPNVGDTIIIYDGICVSQWIVHLIEKKWATPQLLYDFAREIQRLHPNNRVDWYATFMMVEREDYLSKAFKLKQAAKPVMSEESLKSDFIDRVKFGQNSFEEDETNAINEILINNLTQNKLPFKNE